MLIKAQTAATEGMDELCGLNPGLHAAITDTLASHPPGGYEDTETYLSLMYFWGAVIKDGEWCTNGRRAGIDPDLTERTLRWHYGNASEFMRQYTAMVKGTLPEATATATPTPAPIATATPAPSKETVWLVSESTDPLTDEKKVNFFTYAVDHNVASRFNEPYLAVRCNSANPNQAFVVWGGDSLAGTDGLFDGYVRWDAEPALPHRWSESTNNEATFSQEPLEFISQATSATMVFVRVIDSSGVYHDASFELRGLTGHLMEYDALCLSSNS